MDEEEGIRRKGREGKGREEERRRRGVIPISSIIRRML